MNLLPTAGMLKSAVFSLVVLAVAMRIPQVRDLITG